MRLSNLRTTINPYKIIFFLLLSIGYPLTFNPDQIIDQLDGVHGITFGMNQEEIMAVLSDFKPTLSTMDSIVIIEYRKILGKKERVDKLRIFLAPRKGVFWIEEQYYLKWDLQKEDIYNLENHRRKLQRITGLLRSKFGKEDLTEPTDLKAKYREYDFASATWQFPENHWVHLIFEPQDWSIYPELNKILVIYRDSIRDPRKTLPY